MQDKIVQYEAAGIIERAGGKFIMKVFSDRPQEEVRLLALAVIRMGEYVAFLGLEGGERVHVFLACSESLGLDMRELVPIVSPLIEGKGGGRSSFVELSGEKIESLQQALDKAYQHISEKL